jgi:hypothetical protein
MFFTNIRISRFCCYVSAAAECIGDITEAIAKLLNVVANVNAKRIPEYHIDLSYYFSP